MPTFLGKKILVLESDIKTAALLVEDLKSQGYTPLHHASIEGFQNLLWEFKPDFLIIDRILDPHGISTTLVVRRDVAFRTLPILILVESGNFDEKLSALEQGADEVLQKPVQQQELNLKIQALLRRSKSYQSSTEDILYQNLKLSPLSGEVFVDSRRVNFTATEYKLLETLVVEKGRPVRRESLANKSLTSKNPNPRTIDVHINAIRGKLGVMGRNIKTLRGKGYMLVD